MKPRSSPHSALVVLAAIVSLSAGAGTAGARPGVSLGLSAGQWKLGGASGVSPGVELRLNLGAVLALRASYVQTDVPEWAVPGPGYAVVPDLRASVVLTVIPNPYFAPFVAIGGGRAGYTDDRTILITGAGAEISVLPWLTLCGEWNVFSPGPVAAAEAAVERRKAAVKSGSPAPSLKEMFSEHYNLHNTEIRVGLRFTI